MTISLVDEEAFEDELPAQIEIEQLQITKAIFSGHRHLLCPRTSCYSTVHLQENSTDQHIQIITGRYR